LYDCTNGKKKTEVRGKPFVEDWVSKGNRRKKRAENRERVPCLSKTRREENKGREELSAKPKGPGRKKIPKKTTFSRKSARSLKGNGERHNGNTSRLNLYGGRDSRK